MTDLKTVSACADEVCAIVKQMHAKCVQQINNMVQHMYDVVEEIRDVEYRHCAISGRWIQRGFATLECGRENDVTVTCYCQYHQCKQTSNYSDRRFPPEKSGLVVSETSTYCRNGIYYIGNVFSYNNAFPCDLLLAVRNNTKMHLTVQVVFQHVDNPQFTPFSNADYSFELPPGGYSWLGPDHWIPFSAIRHSDVTLLISHGGKLLHERHVNFTFYMGKLTEDCKAFFKNSLFQFKKRNGDYLRNCGHFMEQLPATQIHRYCPLASHEFDCSTTPLLKLSASAIITHRAAQRHAAIKEDLEAVAWHPTRVMDWCLDEEEKQGWAGAQKMST